MSDTVDLTEGGKYCSECCNAPYGSICNDEYCPGTSVEFARLLEQKLAAMTAERDQAIRELGKIGRELGAMTAERDGLRQLLRIYCSENIEDKLRESMKLPPRSQP